MTAVFCGFCKFFLTNFEMVASNPKHTSFHITVIHCSQPVFNMMTCNIMSWNNSVNIVMGYRLDVRGLIPDSSK
jgi:hypothetical protein